MTPRRIAHRLAYAVALVLVIAPADASGQADRRRVDSQRGAELSLFGGAGVSAAGAGAALGWSLGWRPGDRVAIEGSGSWTGDPGTDGFAALIGPRFYLTSPRRATPFITAEAGLFHASVNPANLDAPDFYLDRITGPLEKAFNDFVAAGGAGFDLRLTGHWWMRPQVRMLMVVDGWRMWTLAVPGIHVSYRFGEPTSTP
jgi:hypothetical protein